MLRNLLQFFLDRLPPPGDSLLRQLSEKDRTPLRFYVPIAEADALTQGREAFKNGRFGEALLQFKLATTADPENAWAWHGRGDALQLMGDPKGALLAYETAIQHAEHRGIHHGGRANALEALGQTKGAEAAWRQALSLDPNLKWMRPEPEKDGQ